MGAVISSLYQLGAAAALHTLANKGDGSPAASEPSEQSGATGAEARGVAAEDRRVGKGERRRKGRRGRQRKRWARSLAGKLASLAGRIGSAFCGLWERLNRAKDPLTGAEDPSTGARAATPESDRMSPLQEVCAQWWKETRHPLAEPSFWGARRVQIDKQREMSKRVGGPKVGKANAAHERGAVPRRKIQRWLLRWCVGM